MAALRLIDLFAGCGGMTSGFLSTGAFEVVLAVEADKHAAETYALNFGDEHLVVELIQNVTEFPEADVIVGGPPCQGFSPLNKQREATASRTLWTEYWRALTLVRPAAFVMENVPELLTSAEYAAFKTNAEDTYDIAEGVVNAADYGVPQRRRRALAIGLRKGDHIMSPPWPEKTHGDGRRRYLTVRDAIGALPAKPDGTNWHRRRNPRPESLTRYRAVPKNGGNRHQMQANLDKQGLAHLVPRCWREHATGSHDVFGRLWWDKPSPTIRTEFYKPEKGRYLHPVANRPITIREGALLQTLEDFRFPETQSMTAVGRQIGNAVPPRLAMHIAKALVPRIEAIVGRPTLETPLAA